ncbi:MAG: ABC transporter ATP-binding protein [Bacteroidetes bacterium]|nr:MAG: ABC transporter ATP-binding protein [Bacteroidota bacterium]TAG86053.1 MAG: ABC transporter ATP-binding protein [Bacteroidota bacterium]
MVSVQNISKLYTENIGLFPISFEILPTQCIVIAGESGSGKTTLLQLLAGKITPDSGKIWLNNQLLPLPDTLLVREYKEIACVPQDFKLLPHHKVWENIIYPIRNWTKKQQQQKLETLAQALDLKDLLQRYPREISGGQQQRTAIARALSNEPAVLLLDEPFNQADVRTKIKLQNAIIDIKNELETSLLIVTHNPQEALHLADEIMVLSQGKLVQKATPIQIYEKPIDIYTAELFGKINYFLDNKQKKQGIRPENVRIVENITSLKAKVKKNNYVGTHFQLMVEIENEIWEVWTKNTNDFDKNYIFLEMDKEKILDF